MLQSLVQNDFEITLQHIMRRMRTMNSRAEVVTLLDADGIVARATYGEVVHRADKLANALHGLGVVPGDRVATFAWNTQQHLEAYLAVPCMGAVLHTLNVRLTDDQLVYIINHARDRVILVDDSLLPRLEKIIASIGGVEHFIVIGNADTDVAGSHFHRYEDLLAAQPDGYDYPELDGAAAASLCYTSGTTGNPKGVLYGHRSTVLHAMAGGLTDTLHVCSSDRVLPVVPMFHANAWGLPYTCGILGASLIMSGRYLQAEPLVKLIESERVTFAAAVPTIWTDILRESAPNPEALATLRRIVCGGSAVPDSLMQRFRDNFNTPLIQGFGMTETGPVVAVAAPEDASGEELWCHRTKTGRLGPLVEARIVDPAGNELAWDGEQAGELELAGPWIASGYYLDPQATKEKFHDGWLCTGDIATIDPLGYIQITDRIKDVIKSGGEWISSIEMENALMSHPAVLEAAVIAKPDDRWTERPLPCVVVDAPTSATPEELNDYIDDHFARWQLPDEYAYIAEIPKTSVGKFDKKALRQLLADGELPGRQPVRAIGGVT